MKILVLTNYYPPHHIGGYGMLCLEVVNGLRARGHEVTVLSGKHGVPTDTVEGHVHRRLTLESDLYYYQIRSAWRYPLAKEQNFAILREFVATHQPDLIFVWGMWALTKELAQLAEQLLPGRVAYYLANPWPIDPNLHQRFWDEPATTPLRQLAKKALRLPARLWLRAEWQKTPLQFQHALCCSIALRDQLLNAATPLKEAPVIYEGIDLAPYLAQEPLQAGPSRSNGNGAHATPIANQATYRLLFVGTLSEHKGVHTTLEALAVLRPAERAPFHLTILGSGHPHYEGRLHNLVKTHQLDAWVTFHKPIPRSELPAFLGQYQVLLLPSIWEEPLARIMQEGLAAGMVVIGAATGGTKEIIVHGANGLLFPAADAPALAGCLRLLVADPALALQIAAAGRQTAIEKFAITRMVADIERYLAEQLLGKREAQETIEYATPLSL
ncbi:MAG: glycosyltransferase family 1 protein [Caldilinea sp. CFX5]|nr:glycosyltransferase family 1 protein [Caldilinea sp. CFX5]